MKNLIYLFSILAVLFVTACDPNDDPIIDDPIDEGFITLAELIGQWDFVSYDGYADCDAPENPEHIEKGFFTLNFKNEVPIKIVERGLACSTSDPIGFEYEKNVNEITFFHPGYTTVIYKFTVLSYTPPYLELRLDKTPYQYGDNNEHLGGTLVLEK
jgi:hypothetical protein